MLTIFIVFSLFNSGHNNINDLSNQGNKCQKKVLWFRCTFNGAVPDGSIWHAICIVGLLLFVMIQEVVSSPQVFASGRFDEV
jgi:hypothetical protein